MTMRLRASRTLACGGTAQVAADRGDRVPFDQHVGVRQIAERRIEREDVAALDEDAASGRECVHQSWWWAYSTICRRGVRAASRPQQPPTGTAGSRRETRPTADQEKIVRPAAVRHSCSNGIAENSKSSAVGTSSTGCGGYRKRPIRCARLSTSSQRNRWPAPGTISVRARGRRLASSLAFSTGINGSSSPQMTSVSCGNVRQQRPADPAGRSEQLHRVAVRRRRVLPAGFHHRRRIAGSAGSAPERGGGRPVEVGRRVVAERGQQAGQRVEGPRNAVQAAGGCREHEPAHALAGGRRRTAGRRRRHTKSPTTSARATSHASSTAAARPDKAATGIGKGGVVERPVPGASKRMMRFCGKCFTKGAHISVVAPETRHEEKRLAVSRRRHMHALAVPADELVRQSVILASALFPGLPQTPSALLGGLPPRLLPLRRVPRKVTVRCHRAAAARPATIPTCPPGSRTTSACGTTWRMASTPAGGAIRSFSADTASNGMVTARKSSARSPSFAVPRINPLRPGPNC